MRIRAVRSAINTAELRRFGKYRAALIKAARFHLIITRRGCKVIKRVLQ